MLSKIQRKAIEQTLPHLIIEAIEVFDAGWDHYAVAINNKYLFRFVRRPELIMHTRQEIALCDYLLADNRLKTLAIPQHKPLYADGELLGTYYPLISGSFLTRETITQFSLEHQAAFFGKIIDFLHELHQIPHDSLSHLDQRDKLYWQQLFDDIAAILSNFPEKYGYLSFLEQFIMETNDLASHITFTHGDLSLDHVLTKNQLPTAIIDFGDAHIGDAAIDFIWLYHDFGSILWKYMQDNYHFSYDSALFEKRLQIDYPRLNHAYELLYAKETNNQHMLLETITKL